MSTSYILLLPKARPFYSSIVINKDPIILHLIILSGVIILRLQNNLIIWLKASFSFLPPRILAMVPLLFDITISMVSVTLKTCLV